MENKIYLYTNKDYTDANGKEFTLRDYSSYYYENAKTELDNRPDLFQIIALNDDSKLESIAYDYYGDEDYGDLIAFCNDIDFLWGLSYNTDILFDIKKEYENYYKDALLITKNPIDYTPEDIAKIDAINVLIEDLVEAENSERRKIKIPIPEKLQEVLNIISNNKINMDNIL